MCRQPETLCLRNSVPSLTQEQRLSIGSNQAASTQQREPLGPTSMPNHAERRFRAKTTVAILLAACVTLPSAPAIFAAPRGVPRPASARATRTLNVRDEAQLHFIKASGPQLIDEGRVTGTFPGWVKVRFTYNGEPTVSAALTIYASAGSIRARGSARLSSPVAASPSFRGRMRATGGSGRYTHVEGSGELFGVFYRRSGGLTVQAIGKLSY